MEDVETEEKPLPVELPSEKKRNRSSKRFPPESAKWIRQFEPIGRKIPYGDDVSGGVFVFPYGEGVGTVRYFMRDGEMWWKSRQVHWVKNGVKRYFYLFDLLVYHRTVAHQVAQAIVDICDKLGETADFHIEKAAERHAKREEEKTKDDIGNLGI